MTQGWPSIAQRVQHLAPGLAWHASVCAAGAQTHAWSPREAREGGERSWSTCPAPTVEWMRGCRVEPPGCARDRATRHLAPEDAVTPQPATVVPGGPFMA